MKSHPHIAIEQSDTQDEDRRWQALRTKLAGGGLAGVLKKQADRSAGLNQDPRRHRRGPGGVEGSRDQDSRRQGTPRRHRHRPRGDPLPHRPLRGGRPAHRPGTESAATWSTWQGHLELGEHHAAKAVAEQAWALALAVNPRLVRAAGRTGENTLAPDGA